jgi:hypothetical protein
MRQKLNVVDTSGLTDVDWAVVNRVNRAYEAEASRRFGTSSKALKIRSRQSRWLQRFSRIWSAK